MSNDAIMVGRNRKKNSPGNLLILVVAILVIVVLGTAASYLIFPLHSVPGVHSSKRSFLNTQGFIGVTTIDTSEKSLYTYTQSYDIASTSTSNTHSSINTTMKGEAAFNTNNASCFTNSAIIDVKNKLNTTVFSYKLSHYLCTKDKSHNSSFSYFDAKPSAGYLGDFLVTVNYNTVTAVQKLGYIQAKGAFQVTSGLKTPGVKIGFSCTASLTLNEYPDGHFTVDEHDCN